MANLMKYFWGEDMKALLGILGLDSSFILGWSHSVSRLFAKTFEIKLNPLASIVCLIQYVVKENSRIEGGRGRSITTYQV